MLTLIDLLSFKTEGTCFVKNLRKRDWLLAKKIDSTFRLLIVYREVQVAYENTR